MRPTYALAALALALGGCSSTTSSASPPAAATTPSPALVAAPTDSFAAVRQRAVGALRQRIAGKEAAPAESVFQNIKMLKRVPAGRLLAIMDESFGHGLGVGCGFCHVPGQWASDQKPNKDVARDMLAMVGRINTDLRAMRNLPDSNPSIGCMTCHRGQQKPALNAPR
jgi:hypothetical protein